MALYHFSAKVLSRSSRNTVRSLAYRAGCELYDVRTGQFFNYSDKPVQHVELVLPKDAPEWARNIQTLMSQDRQKSVQAFSELVEMAEKRIDAQIYREFEFALHRELTEDQNIALAKEFVEDQIASRGMSALLNFHFDVDEETKEAKPHCHVLATLRRLDENGFSQKKERDWNKKELVLEFRRQWQDYSNFHLKLHGHDIQIDHRSHKERGIEIEPQPKLGRGILEQERKHQEALKSSQQRETNAFATDKAKAFHDAQLRNLYRILRRPEVVFDIVTKHHATFMWGDVQKVLHRYVDEAPLFERMDARLRNSKELLLLRPESVNDSAGRSEEKAVYTTRTMLKAERDLVETAESLASRETHGVSLTSLEKGLHHIQEKLRGEGFNLSADQEKAIRHLVEDGQLKCIVGYAGAGKTTALSACREIWEAEGYSVYGLAPTGRAAQNLEGSGISSQTLHKFLKSFESGRCHYYEKSILVLDEGGMVDVERFDGFLRAVKKLGVKAVVVGDAAQLQPVEAGPAFRLVTERVGVSRLEEVVRQKIDWQREATMLFGKQETKKAIQAYQSQGHIHLIEEKLPGTNHPQDVVKRYEISARTSGLIYREILKDVQAQDELNNEGNLYERAKEHEDYPLFLKWREIKKEAGNAILEKADMYRPFLEARNLDPIEMARLFVDKDQNKEAQYNEARDLLIAKKLDHLIGIERTSGQTVEVRSSAKAALIEDWQKAYKEDPQKELLIMAYSNCDVKDLNTAARDFLKASGHIETKEFMYMITREIDDDFGRKFKVKEERKFSKGDKIIFTRNNDGLGVKNGSMGMITELDSQRIQVKLDKEEDITFAPNLNPYFDNGWAVTIHKTQGIDGAKCLVLASHEMNQNLTYVAMTRHRNDVQIYGSSCDFWREEKVADILSKSGEKLGAADYLDAKSLAQLMKEEDRFLNRIFTRLSDELQAIGAVSKQAFNAVADHFLGKERSSDKDILIKPEAIREEARAHHLFQKTPVKIDRQPEQKNENIISTLQDVYEDMKHPAFRKADHYKKVFQEGLKLYGETGAIQYWQSKRKPFLRMYEQKLEAVEQELKSPLLSYFSDEARDLARKAALDDPDKTLNFLS